MKIQDRIVGFKRVLAKDLRPNPNNWRKHPESQHDALRGILAEIGYVDAVMARKLKDGSLQLIDGHLRAETTPDMKLPVLIVDLTDEEAQKVLLTFDAITEMAEADEALLASLVADFETDSEALKAMVDQLMAEVGKGEISLDDIVQDEVPLPPDKAISQRGDIWQLGPHRLMCGDSSSPSDLDKLLDGASIHLVNTDPPYNVKVEPRSNNAIAAGLSSFAGTKHHQQMDVARSPGKAKPTEKKLRAKDRPLANDFVSDEEFDRLLAAWFGNISRVLLPGRSFYIWGGYANCANYPPVMKAKALYFSQAVIWHKQHPVLTRKDFMGDHEWCFYGWREGKGHEFLGPNNVPDVWQVKKVHSASMVHLTEKPVELSVRAIQYSSRKGENVLDLFGGSGSTLMGAEQTERRAFLMELDPLYCDVICKRYEQSTGVKPFRIGEKKTPVKTTSKKKAKK
ncbi:MAG: DNA methyltransferase [Planctomycetaceae bacterium]